MKHSIVADDRAELREYIVADKDINGDSEKKCHRKGVDWLFVEEQCQHEIGMCGSKTEYEQCKARSNAVVETKEQ